MEVCSSPHTLQLQILLSWVGFGTRQCLGGLKSGRGRAFHERVWQVSGGHPFTTGRRLGQEARVPPDCTSQVIIILYYREVGGRRQPHFADRAQRLLSIASAWRTRTWLAKIHCRRQPPPITVLLTGGQGPRQTGFQTVACTRLHLST